MQRLLEAAYASNTRRAYRSDIDSFRRWGGHLPSDVSEIAAYIADQAEVLSPMTIRRHLAALSQLHKALGISPNPVKSPHIGAMLRGLSRLHGRPQRAVIPLLITDLRAILDIIPDTTIGSRDACLLALGFAGGLRRSELVGLDVSDVQIAASGICLHLKRSKTDQAGKGRTVGIPVGRTKYCPTRILTHWLSDARLQDGPLLRAVTKSGTVKPQRLSSEAVATVVKKWVAKIGLCPADYSGHSLRAGFVISAIQAGASEHSIRKQTGHASSATMERYIRIANVFEDNACNRLF